MTGPTSEDFKCATCGGPVRCVGGGFVHDLDGAVIGMEEGYDGEECDHSGKVVYESVRDDELEIYRLSGVDER